jgi:hypothetical protein
MDLIFWFSFERCARDAELQVNQFELAVLTPIGKTSSSFIVVNASAIQRCNKHVQYHPRSACSEDDVDVSN